MASPTLDDLIKLMARRNYSLEKNFARNQPYIATGRPVVGYNTPLSPLEEMAFRQWARTESGVPFKPDVQPQDYDLRGFYQALQQGDPRAASAIDPNDNRLHYPDIWKTPYHETFSNQSMYATPDAPQWNDQDQLIAPSGRIVFDDKDQEEQ